MSKSTRSDLQAPTTTSPLESINWESISQQAQREIKNRESHLPPVSVFRWWARRPETVMGGLVHSLENSLKDESLRICDPFAGGGTVGLAAVKRGHSVHLQDINPWSARGLRTTFSLPDLDTLKEQQNQLKEALSNLLEKAYKTQEPDTNKLSTIAHTLWVRSGTCPECGHQQPIYPGALVSLRDRKECGDGSAWLACPAGHLFLGNHDEIHDCPSCDRTVDPTAQYTRGRRMTCVECEHRSELPLYFGDTFDWQIALVETCRDNQRTLRQPTDSERRQAAEWDPNESLGRIPDGSETRILHRYGFKRWEDCYPDRQRTMLESVLKKVRNQTDEGSTLRRSLKTLVVGSAEMAGFCSRWDRYYLKAYETIAHHRFNVTTLSCEPNVWGAAVGRGTLKRRFEQFERAITWFANQDIHFCFNRSDPPTKMSNKESDRVHVSVREGTSTQTGLPDGSIDAIVTDPPYHDDVQYGELSGIFRAWLDASFPWEEEAVAVQSKDQRYCKILTGIFEECRRILSARGHMLLTFANKNLRAWEALLTALDTAGFSAAGFTLACSDKEDDPLKGNQDSCSIDLIFDLLPNASPSSPCMSEMTPDTEQIDFLLRIGNRACKGLNRTENVTWEEYLKPLRQHSFASS